MNRYLRKPGLSLQALWVIGLLWLLSGTAMAQMPAGQVMVVTGSVKAINAQGKERSLEKGGELRDGDRIVTGDSGLAQVRMADGGYLSIRANTDMKIDTFHHDEKDQRNSSFLVSLVKGGFRSITGLIGRSNPGAYKISAGTATIGIRGTDHEPMLVPPAPPNIPVINAPGVYDKVNDGETFIQNERGILSLKPGQIGFAPVMPEQPPVVVLKVPDFYRENVKTDARDPKDAARRKDDDKGTAVHPAGTALRPGFADRQAPAGDAPTGTPRTGTGETAPRVTAPTGVTGPLPVLRDGVRPAPGAIGSPVERPLASPNLPPPPVPLMPPPTFTAPLIVDRAITTTVQPPPLLPPPLLPPLSPTTTTIIR